MTGTTVKQGEKADVKIGISRGQNFDRGFLMKAGSRRLGETKGEHEGTAFRSPASTSA